MNQRANTPAKPTSPADITDWRPEDPVFWETTGKKIAYRQLWISWPSLLPGFSVWLMWGMITVQMLNLGFPFTAAQLFTITAIAGLSGATLRIPASFFVRLAGGRNAIFFTTSLLLIPAIGTGFALLDPNTPLWVFQLLALLSGIGGGNFAASMSENNDPSRGQGATVAVFPVAQGDQIMLVTNRGTLIRVPVDDISIRRRRSGGVTVFKVDEGERVMSVARLPDTGVDVGNGDAGSEEEGAAS